MKSDRVGGLAEPWQSGHLTLRESGDRSSQSHTWLGRDNLLPECFALFAESLRRPKIDGGLRSGNTEKIGS